MEGNVNRPATLADLNDLEQRFGRKMDARLEVFETEFKADLKASTNALIEKMRDMQTELLRGFASIAAGQDIRLRKLEADTSNINHSTTQRLALLEQPMFEVRARLALDPPPPRRPDNTAAAAG